MTSYRENPDGDENQWMSLDNDKAVFAAKLMAEPTLTALCGAPSNASGTEVCQRPSGHEGWHLCGVMGWSDEEAELARRLEAQRKARKRAGRRPE